MIISGQQKRVQFDFEVEFLNGGGIQGQGFRLDIDGDDIDDRALAQYIVQDLRLLMVGRALILNKSIIVEPHKRSNARAAVTGRENDPAKTLIDLSHTIEDGMDIRQRRHLHRQSVSSLQRRH